MSIPSGFKAPGDGGVRTSHWKFVPLVFFDYPRSLHEGSVSCGLWCGLDTPPVPSVYLPIAGTIGHIHRPGPGQNLVQSSHIAWVSI